MLYANIVVGILIVCVMVAANNNVTFPEGCICNNITINGAPDSPGYCGPYFNGFGACSTCAFSTSAGNGCTDNDAGPYSGNPCGLRDTCASDCNSGGCVDPNSCTNCTNCCCACCPNRSDCPSTATSTTTNIPGGD